MTATTLPRPPLEAAYRVPALMRGRKLERLTSFLDGFGVGTESGFGETGAGGGFGGGVTVIGSGPGGGVTVIGSGPGGGDGSGVRVEVEGAETVPASGSKSREAKTVPGSAQGAKEKSPPPHRHRTPIALQ